MKEAHSELLVKGRHKCFLLWAPLNAYSKTAAECVSDRGKEVCSEIDGQCITERDGYYYVSAICMSFGVLFLVFYIIPTARKLQGR